MMRRQQGVALVQVLLVTTIIILLVMQLSLTAADQVKRAQQLKDRSEAALALILGEDEVRDQRIGLKNMRGDGGQESVARPEIADKLQASIDFND